MYLKQNKIFAILLITKKLTLSVKKWQNFKGPEVFKSFAALSM